MERKYRDKEWNRNWREGHPENSPTGDLFHMQTRNPDIIDDMKKCLLAGTWYSCLLRGSAICWLIQMWKLTANYRTEHWAPNGGIRGGTEGAEGALSGMNGRVSPWSCEGLMPQCRGMLAWWGEAGMGRWVEEHPHRIRVRSERDGIGNLQRRNWERG